MGIVDQTTHSLKCSCGAAESVVILQHGSAYGGSWQAGKPMVNFTVVWSNGEYTGPCISSATCNACGAKPAISTS